MLEYCLYLDVGFVCLISVRYVLYFNIFFVEVSSRVYFLNGATGNRWWYDCVRCGDDMSVKWYIVYCEGSLLIFLEYLGYMYLFFVLIMSAFLFKCFFCGNFICIKFDFVVFLGSGGGGVCVMIKLFKWLVFKFILYVFLVFFVSRRLTWSFVVTATTFTRILVVFVVVIFVYIFLGLYVDNEFMI